MITALTLLVTALQLKLALLGLPLQYKDFVDANMPIVEQAIILAQTEMANPPVTQQTTQPVVNTNTNTTTNTVTQPQAQPNTNNIILGNTIQNNQTNMEIILKNENGFVYGDSVTIQSSPTAKLIINADLLSNGKSQLETITMTSSDGQSRVQDKNERACSQRVMGGPRDDCSINFAYRVPEAGTFTVTFTSGEIVKTLTVNAQ